MPYFKGSFLQKRYRIFWWPLLMLVALVIVLFVGFKIFQYRRNMVAISAKFPPFPALTSTDRIMVLSPHPDDETLGAGGLVAKARKMGLPVRVVFLTNGDGSLATRLVQDARFLKKLADGKGLKLGHKNPYRQMAPMRQKEALAALAKLGVDKSSVSFLGYPDGGTKEMWDRHWTKKHPYTSRYTKLDKAAYKSTFTPNAPYCGQQALADVTQIMAKFRPTLIITTNSHDTHPDHWAAFAYLNAALMRLRSQKKYFSWASKARSYSFVIHHGLWPVPHGFHPKGKLAPPEALVHAGMTWQDYALPSAIESAKESALEQYKSQLATTPQFLRGFVRVNELFSRTTILSRAAHPSISDPRNDLLLSRLVPGADITSLSVQSDSKVLLLNLHLDDKPSRALQYRFSLHSLNATQSKLLNLTARRLKDGSWKVLLSKTISAHSKGHTITLKIPLQKIRLDGKMPDYLLMSSATLLRSKVLDQTPLGIVKWK